MGWPDAIVGLALLFGALRGWRTGLVRELTGILAIAAAIAAAFTYRGTWDAAVANHSSLGPGSVHVLAMVLYAVAAYAIVTLAGMVLGRVAKLPIIGTANAALGATIGIAKSAIFVWAVLYVALFFPLSTDLRNDLHASPAVALFEQPNGRMDQSLRSSLPEFVQPLMSDIFERHRV